MRAAEFLNFAFGPDAQRKIAADADEPAGGQGRGAVADFSMRAGYQANAGEVRDRMERGCARSADAEYDTAVTCNALDGILMHRNRLQMAQRATRSDEDQPLTSVRSHNKM